MFALLPFRDGGSASGPGLMLEVFTSLQAVARSSGDDAQLVETDRGGVFTIDVVVDCIGREEDREDAGDRDGGYIVLKR